MEETSVIIVNWNGLENLRFCLPSLKRQSYQNFKLIFVDNGSKDESVIFTKKIFPDAKIIKLNKNYGFAKPNNLGFKFAKGKYLLTLNNDVELPPSFLMKAVFYLSKTNSDVFAIAPKMLFYDNRNKINTIGIKLLENGSAINLGKNESRYSEKFNVERKIFGPCAGCALYKTDIIKKLGGLFDESYFAYLEDVELSIRANLKGYSAKYVPELICYHKHSSTAERMPFKKIYLIERNRLRNMIKYYRIKYIFLEPFLTLKILLNARKSKGEGGFSDKQKKMLRMSILIFPLILSARIKVMLEIFKLLGERECCIR